MLQTTPVKAKLFRILRPFRGSPVDDENVGDLIELDIERQRLSLDKVDVPLTHQVAIPFICLLAKQLADQFGIRLQEQLVSLRGGTKLRADEGAPRPCCAPFAT